MIRAILDTNVLASGFVSFANTQRAPSQLLHLWRESHFVLVVSLEIVAELLSTFASSYFQQRLTPAQIENARHLLMHEAELARISVHISGAATHPEDDAVLAAAVSARVDYLVTGDKGLLELGHFRGVRIITPREFLEELGAGARDDAHC